MEMSEKERVDQGHTGSETGEAPGDNAQDNQSP